MENSRTIKITEIPYFFTNSTKESALPANSFNRLRLPDQEIDLVEQFDEHFQHQRMADGSPIVFEREKKFKKKKQ